MLNAQKIQGVSRSARILQYIQGKNVNPRVIIAS